MPQFYAYRTVSSHTQYATVLSTSYCQFTYTICHISTHIVLSVHIHSMPQFYAQRTVSSHTQYATFLRTSYSQFTYTICHSCTHIVLSVHIHNRDSLSQGYGRNYILGQFFIFGCFFFPNMCVVYKSVKQHRKVYKSQSKCVSKITCV